MKTTTKQAEIVAAYRANFDEAAALLRLLTHHIDELGHADIETIHWGHVGDARALVEILASAAAMVVNLDPTSDELHAALAAYSRRHGLTKRN